MHVINCLGQRKVDTDSAASIYMPKNPTGGSWRVKSGNFQIYNTTTQAWHTIFVQGPAGFEQIAIGPSDASLADGKGFMELSKAGNSWRVKDGNFQIWGVTTSLWYTIFAMGAVGAEQLAIGGGEA